MTDRTLGRASQEEIKNSIRAQLSDRLGGTEMSWELKVCASSIPDAGEGVFVSGRCMPGSVLCAYPGTAYLPEDMPSMHSVILPGNEYIIARTDGVIIDGRDEGASAEIAEIARRRDGITSHQKCHAAFGVDLLPPIANKVNHPPGSERPNVIAAPLDLLPSDTPDLHDLLDGFCLNFRAPIPSQTPMKRTIVLIALRDLNDHEELFLDYRRGGLRNGLREEESWYFHVSYSST